MNKTLLALLSAAGLSRWEPAAATASDDLATYARFRARQRQQRREDGSMRRSNALLDLVQGKLERGTRAQSRGPYPQHLIANCEKMRARGQDVRARALERANRRPRIDAEEIDGVKVTVNGQTFLDVDTISYGDQ
jgi:hypothetical protein